MHGAPTIAHHSSGELPKWTSISRQSRSRSTTCGCLIIVCMCCLPHSSRGVDDTECLVAFKASVVDGHNLLSNWDFGNFTPGYVCGFSGVLCWHGYENSVGGLELSRFGLAGDPFPEGLSKCTSLQTLDLSINSFSTPLPSDLCKQLPYLTTLNLSHNQFSGDIPSSLGQDCLYLQRLHLQGNLFSGEIPWELGTLPHLCDLDLSHNLLSGPIPSSFTNRSCAIPASAFQHNPLLCGPPLSSSCPSHDGPERAVYYIEIAFGAGAGAALLLLITAFLLRLVRQYGSLRSSNSTAVEMYDPYLRLSWSCLGKATSNFSHANILGIGGSSTVYKGQLPDGQIIAIKVLQKEDNCSLSCDVRKQFLTELEVLGKLRHRNLVRILGYCYNLEDTMAIIIDFMPMGSLDALLHHHSRTPMPSDKGNSQQLAQSPYISWEARFCILMGIAEGLAYLHHEYDGKRCIIHGDLKPGNVLLDEHMEAHIADFGLPTMIEAANTTSISLPSWRRAFSNARGWSFGYTAPECAQQGVATRKADVFSFGITMLELMTGERPSSSKLKEGQTLADWVGHTLASGTLEELVNIVDIEGTWKEWEADVVAVLKLGCRCTSYKPSARPDMKQIVAFLHELAGKRHSASHLVYTNPFQTSQRNIEDELWMLSNMSGTHIQS